MRGKPKFLNTKEDYQNLMAMPETVVTTEEKKAALNDLLANVKEWMFVKELASEEEGITDETHKVVISEPTPDSLPEGVEPTKTYMQYEFTKNPGARIFLLGFTVEEVQAMLASLG